MKVDYIIIGFGLAGLAFARTLEHHNKSYIIFEDQSQQSSMVAGGMYNPVVLKRFTPVWKAHEQLAIAIPFYASLERDLHKTYNKNLDILRIFKSVGEQNNWLAACDNPALEKNMNAELVTAQIKGVQAPFGFGRVTGTGQILVKRLLADYRNKLMNENKLISETFRHNQMQLSSTEVNYRGLKSSKILFCEGYGIKNNPYFNYLPLMGSKGELITIKAPDLELHNVLKAAVFVMPLGNDFYRVGATFNSKDKTNLPTKQGQEELLNKLNTFIKTPFEIISHVAGIRPTVADRRPLIGSHRDYSNVCLLNGLGTRGVIIAPYAAKCLYDYLEKNKKIPNEMDIRRFS